MRAMGGWVWLAVIMLAGVFAGCSSTPQVDWDSRVGSYTFDQVVTEMGPPERDATLEDGTRVGEWFERRGANTSVGFGVGGTSVSGVGVGVNRTVNRQYNHYLQLTFDAAGKLAKWQRIER